MSYLVGRPAAVTVLDPLLGDMKGSDMTRRDDEWTPTEVGERPETMGRIQEPVEIDDVPVLVDLAQRLRESGRPLLLTHRGAVVAVLMPVDLADDLGIERPPTDEEIAASQAAAGGWNEVDTDRLVEDIYARRGRPVRPTVER